MYIRLNTAIDSTANRATVEYVDNAINVSLGKITNALNTNNLNVDNIINTIEAKSSAPDCYIYYDNAKGQMWVYINNNKTDFPYLCANWGTSYPDSVPMFFPNNATNLAYAYWNTNISYGSDYATSFLTHAHDISKDVKNLCNCCSNYNVSSYLSNQVQQCRGATFIFYQYDNLIDVNFFLSADGWNYSDLNNDIYPITQMVSFVGENSPANNCYTNHLRGIVNLNSLTKSYNVYATDNYYSSVYRQVKYCNSLIEGIHSNDKYHVYLSSKENMNISVDNFDWLQNNPGYRAQTYYHLDPGVWPILSKNVTNLSNLFNNGNAFIDPAIRGAVPFMLEDPNSIINMYQAYANLNWPTGRFYDTPKAVNMYRAYSHCSKIWGNAPNVCSATNLSDCFYNCYGLEGQASNMYGDNVNMSWAYTYCHRLEYAPSYIKSAPNMEGCFMDCHNIKTPIVANDTINFFACYARCFNLEYSCMSDSVKNAGQAFCNCYNISNFCFGNNLVDCREMYYNAGRDFGGTFPEVFIYAENISNAVNCFYGAGKTYSGGSSRIVIYLLADTVTNNSFNYSIINSSLTINTNNNCRYNSSRNVYIYWKSLDEMKQLDINNWYSNGIHK